MQLINIGGVISSDQNCTETKKCYSQNADTNNIDVNTKFDQSFSNFRSFEDLIKPKNQFDDLFGIGGFQEQRLKRGAFKL